MNKLTVLLLSSLFCAATQAAQTTVTINSTGEGDNEIGQVVFSDTDFGLLIVPNLSSLPPGLHGFHLHQHPDCGDHGNDAGSHFDPAKTNSHKGPYDKGHLGDLPVLYVGADGKASTPILAPRLKTTDLTGLSVMIHAGGDNYSDNPPLGGGGARIACGPVK
ncbi:Superoxide dismutase [Cu-Zn] 1 precursor [Legionella massiliensis]|uniref:Superoxide dismutase [Cu-Zn] n=1 Tax=Legionella massiliensis TaxID=1034943 RepID=A0A078KYV9_9GAMM|nr:superoxide dismutase family protein [Legionella massiliensis]CDZ76934.1 Superoxide dismutase [Cu-Zn] 1 precursor [Legionella massiliensis]CEE12672.1 Superoxide dismutase [Cu-Zn] 1 precursor [Legionella massiliensis]